VAKVTMPQLGESVAEGTIGKWLKQPGDTVAKYEPLLEVITDKVNAEVPSPFAGVLKEILAEEGATVPNNAEIAVIETDEESGGAAAEPAAAEPAAAEPAAAEQPQRARPALMRRRPRRHPSRRRHPSPRRHPSEPPQPPQPPLRPRLPRPRRQPETRMPG
jgi:pyruvate/2-oxoglutarate dehydrogenase complex dihydrolipoamide acyltransferase (E2) component